MLLYHTGTAIDLSSHIGTGQYVSIQYDGYLSVECPKGETNQCYVQDAYNNHLIVAARSNGTFNGFASIYVKKGMSFFLDGVGTVKFIPFVAE